MGFEIQFPEGWAEWLLWATVHGSILIGFVLLAQWALRDRLSARWHSALWWLVILRLLMPVSVESELSLFNLWPENAGSNRQIGAVTEFTSSSSASPQTTSSASSSEGIGAQAEGLPEIGAESGAMAPSSNRKEARAQSTGQGRISWMVVAVRIWLVGAIVVAFLLILFGFLQHRRLRFQPWIRDERAIGLLAECQRKMGVKRRLDIVQAPTASTPALYGLFRPWLLLPRNLHRELSNDRLRHVFLHELAHLKRGDVVTNWIGAVLLLVHWFNPLVWLAVVRMRTDCELAADELALSFVGENENQSYGETILGILKRATQAPPVPGLVGCRRNQQTHKKENTHDRKDEKIEILVVPGCRACDYALRDSFDRPLIR